MINASVSKVQEDFEKYFDASEKPVWNQYYITLMESIKGQTMEK